ncbi:MAG: hypothetical protein FJ161_04280 [Gammaproteobacteria bacterium]|nr:hypothetical protein [Gammaproteobacteria bacterium]
MRFLLKSIFTIMLAVGHSSVIGSETAEKSAVLSTTDNIPTVQIQHSFFDYPPKFTEIYQRSIHTQTPEDFFSTSINP